MIDHLRSLPVAARFVAVAVLAVAPVAEATFPFTDIDCGIFDFDNPDFLGDDFGFATEAYYTQGTDPQVSTGYTGFRATPEQVAFVEDFVAGADLPTGSSDFLDLFDGGVTPPDNFSEGRVWQSIQGEGGFGAGFTEVTLNQRKRLTAEQADGDFALLGVNAKAYAPFEVVGPAGGPVDVTFTIDLFSLLTLGNGGAASEEIVASIVNVTDPDNVAAMDAVSGFYFESASSTPFAEFTRTASDGSLSDITGNLFTDGTLASFFYEIQTQLMPGETYAMTAFTNGVVDLFGESNADLNSNNTFSVSVSVDTPGAALVLPGIVVPEPAALMLALFALATARGRRVTASEP